LNPQLRGSKHNQITFPRAFRPAGKSFSSTQFLPNHAKVLMICWSNTVIGSAQGLSDRSNAHKYNFINFLAQGYLLPCSRSSVPHSLVSCCSQHLNEVTIVHQGKMTHLTPLQDIKRSNTRAESQLRCCNKIKILSAPQTHHS